MPEKAASRKRFSHAVSWFLILILLVLAPAAVLSADREDEDREPTVEERRLQREEERKAEAAKREAEAVEYMISYYVRMFSKHLESPDWMARAMATISLARMDYGQSTAKLLQVARADKLDVVRAYAWEALHARQDKLDPEQRMEWVEIGFDLARKGVLRGDMRLGIIGLIEAAGPTEKNKKILMGLFDSTNSMDGSDIRTLRALGDTITRWRSGDMVRYLIEKMSDLNDAYRAELVLHRVYDGIPYSYRSPALDGCRSETWYTKLYHEGSRVMWQITQKRWADWFKDQDFKEIDPGELGPYKGLSTLMPAGEQITDSRDRRWAKDLELGAFMLDQVDVAFAVDSTGSMGRVVRWIQRDVVKMMRAFSLISYEPRIGVNLYRDHGDKYVIKAIPLTGDAQALSADLDKADAKGGGDIPEAVYEALGTILTKKNWSGKAGARKVVVLVGDAPPHQESMEDIEKLVKEAVERGFIFSCIKVRTRHSAYVTKYFKDKKNWDPQLTSFDKIAQWGGGKSVWVSFLAEHVGRSTGTARPKDENTPDRLIFRTVLKLILEEGYKDRVDPFINILLEYVERPMPERRSPFGPARRGGRHKPRDVQEDR